MKNNIITKFHVNNVYVVVWGNHAQVKGKDVVIPNITLVRYYADHKTTNGFREKDLPDMVEALNRYMSGDYVNENKEEHRNDNVDESKDAQNS